jgi:DNA-binding ferritin-like protein
MPMHLLMNDIYQFFGDDNIDRIKERVRILWGNTPASIFELSQLTDIQELESVPQMMWLLEIVASDLRTIEDFLSAGINTTGDKWDLVTQNQMINFADAVWTFRWKIEMSIPKKEEWKPLSPIKK